MPSRMLQDGLNDHEIGTKIRALRLKKTSVPDVTDASAHRALLWRRAGVLLRGRA